MDTPEPTNPWQPTEASVESVAEPVSAPARNRRPFVGLALIAAGALGATLLTGVAFASNSTPPPVAPAAPNAPAVPGAPGAPGLPGDGDHGPGGPGDGDRGPGMMGGMGGMGALQGLATRILHGEVVVRADGGGTATMRVQIGQVTAVSADQLTVRSSDGVEQVWPLTAQTHVHRNGVDASVGDIVVGDTAVALGEVTGGSVATTEVMVLDAQRAAVMLGQRDQGQPGA